MIRELSNDYNELILDFLMKDSIVNYFIIQGLKREKFKETFVKKWGEFNNNGDLIAILLKRKSLNMQFYGKCNYDYKGFIRIINNEKYNKLIGEYKILENIINNHKFSNIKKGSSLCKLDNNKNLLSKCKNYNIKKLTTNDLDKVINLYEKVFNGFTSKKLMVEKLKNGTGRGYYIEINGEIVSVAQSDYENNNSAIIVGVGTDPEFQNRGYASDILIKLCKELQDEGKEIYLQYDNLHAGKIYQRLGFINIGRMINCYC